MEVKTIAVIGGGASGLCAAIAAAREGRDRGYPVPVTLYERNAAVGKKLLMTGNGRCNLTNLRLRPSCYNTPRALSLIHLADSGGTRAFFEAIGILTRADECGRVYPCSMQASGVVRALRLEAEQLGVQIQTQTHVACVERAGEGFLLNRSVACGSVIVACGGSSYPATGSDGDGVRLLEQLGVHCKPTLPALTAVETSDKGFRPLKGVRARANVCAIVDGRRSPAEQGELQFTDYGLSGIAVMQLSRGIARALADGKGHRITIEADLASDFPQAELQSFIRRMARDHAHWPAAELLCGIVPGPLGVFLLRRCGIRAQALCGSVGERTAAELAREIKAFAVPVKAVRGFNQAQVTAGGADLRGFDDGLMYRRIPGLFACGEVLDVDGACGGYNLEWAFSSGRLCGRSAVCFIMGDRDDSRK